MLFIYFFFSECMGVREVKPIFQDNEEHIGNRDFMVIFLSAICFLHNCTLLIFNTDFVYILGASDIWSHRRWCD